MAAALQQNKHDMTIPSFTILIRPDDSFDFIATSRDAQECVDAWKECDEQGTVVFFRKGKQQRIKRNVHAPEAPAKKTAKKRTKS